MAGGDGGGRDRHQFGAADLAQDLDRVGDAGDPPDRFLHGGALAGEALVVDAGATADPGGRLATGERGGDRRRRRGVADAHLAEHEQVAVERRRPRRSRSARPARTDARTAPLSNRMSPVGWPTPTSIAVDLGAGDAGERVDRRAALAVGGEHRLGHARRVGADLRRRGDAVVGGEDQSGRLSHGGRGRCVASPPPTRRSRRARPAHRSVAGCRPRGRAPRRGRSRRPAAERRVDRGGVSSRCGSGLVVDDGGVVEAEGPAGDEEVRVLRVGGPALVHRAEDVAVPAPERGVGVHAEADLVRDDDDGVGSRGAAPCGGRRGGRRSRRRSCRST